MRLPFDWDDRETLAALSLDERMSRRSAELDRYTGDVRIPVPPEPGGKPPSRKAQMLPPRSDAIGGTIEAARNAWVAKYDPRRAARDSDIGHSDVFRDFVWDKPDVAIGEPWIQTEFMRGVSTVIHDVEIGDLVFAMRTMWLEHDGAWLKRRCLVGLWWVEGIASFPTVASSGRSCTQYEVSCQPIRRFDFPVPIQATSDQDKEFADIGAFTDRARRSFLGLLAQEAVAVARNCGLPAAILAEPDPDKLTAAAAMLDLGPPTTVRRRIVEGARAAAHRKSVEASARDVAVASLTNNGFGVISTERERGLGSDLWAKAIEPDGTETDVRVEVKGLSGADPWAAHLTRSELDAAKRHCGSANWWLVIITRALRTDRQELWLSADEVTRIFIDKHKDFVVADKRIARVAMARG